MFLNDTADKLVFKFLNKINYGYLELTTHNGKVLKFGIQMKNCMQVFQSKNQILIII